MITINPSKINSLITKAVPMYPVTRSTIRAIQSIKKAIKPTNAFSLIELLSSMREFHSKIVATIKMYEDTLESWPGDDVKVCFDRASR